MPGDGVTFRRTGLAWRILPALGLLLVANAFVRSPPLLSLTVVSCALLLPYTLVCSLQYVVLGPDTITVGTRFVSKATLLRAELVECRRIRASIVVSLYVNVLRLADARLAARRRAGVIISPYGWGKRRRELFTQLGRWVMTSPAAIDEDTANFVARYSRLNCFDLKNPGRGS